MAGSRAGFGAYLIGVVVGLFFSLVLAAVLSLVAPPVGAPEMAQAPQAETSAEPPAAPRTVETPQPAPTEAPAQPAPEPEAPAAAQPAPTPMPAPEPEAPAAAQPAPAPEPEASAAAQPTPEPEASATAQPTPPPAAAPAARADDTPPALLRHARAYDGDLSAPLLAIVLDGVGAGGAPVADLLTLPGPLTLVIDPTAADATLLAEDARGVGFEAMFAASSKTLAAGAPGIAALLDGDPPVIGMATSGADLTESPQLSALAAEMAARGMALLDLTAAGGGASYRMARSSSLPAAPLGRRFDEVKSSAAVYQALERAAFDARRAGAYVVVARPDAAVLTGLRRWLNVKANKSVNVAPLSAVIARLSN